MLFCTLVKHTFGSLDSVLELLGFDFSMQAIACCKNVTITEKDMAIKAQANHNI